MSVGSGTEMRYLNGSYNRNCDKSFLHNKTVYSGRVMSTLDPVYGLLCEQF